MTKEIALVNFNEEQIKLIKTQIAPEATENELGLFLYQAKRTGLDPLTRQLYCIHRNTKDARGNWVKKMTIQTSIDGFRVIAERSGDYGGQDEPIFNEQDGKLISCKITVYRFRGDVRYPAAVGVAYWSEYVQTDKDGNASGLWKKMPHTMLAKVAEALALRKAYPQDLSGLYTGDEMAQTEITEELKPANKTGITQNLAAGVDEDMKEVFNDKNQADYEKIKKAIVGCGSVEELEAEKLKFKKEANSLKKYRPELYAEIADLSLREEATILGIDVAELTALKKKKKEQMEE